MSTGGWPKSTFSDAKEKTLPPPPPPPYRVNEERKIAHSSGCWKGESSHLARNRPGDSEEGSSVERSALKQLISRAKTLLSSDASSPSKHWKPVTLRALILGPFILISLAFIIILELLAHLAGLSSTLSGSGAVAYAENDGNFSTSVSFAYLYFPTVIAVCYSVLWSWVDLDAKRLEPWFQLSQEGGASAENSLLLQYPFEFLAFVPIKAARRKQWAVFFTGTAMVIIFWAITPLQSAIFGTESVIRIRAAQMMTTATLMPPDSQVNSLNANFLMTAYSILWLGQKLPPYTKPSRAVMPFAPTVEDSSVLQNGTWSTYAEAYSTNLTCTPAKTVPHGSLIYDFDNGRGCSVPGIVLPDAQSDSSSYMLTYIGYYNDAHVDWALENPSCPLNSSHNFLAVWADGASQTSTGEYSNMTALFCETSYTVQNITVQINASDFSIVSDNVENAGPRSSRPPTALSEDIFNITNFEYIIGSGVTQETQITDYPNTSPVEQYPRFSEYNLTWPSTNMVGYAIAAAPDPAEFGDPVILRSAFLKAHQLLFSVAFNNLLEPLPNSTVESVRDGNLQDQPTAVVLVRVFSVVVEILLGIMCFLAAAIWFISARRESQMVRDPARIGDIMSMVSECRALKEVFRDMGTISKDQLNVRLRHKKFRLRGIVDHEPHIMHLEVLLDRDDGVDNKTDSALAQPQPASLDNFTTIARPVELRNSTAFLFIGTLATSIGGLVYLSVFMSRTNGLKLPSSNAVIRQILENYLPTVLATVLEPYWVVLNRLLCILKPFDELRKGKARPSRSIDVKYTSLPPPLVFWRALKSHHFLLAIVCSIAMLANVLAVSLSSLFNEAGTCTTGDLLSTYTVGSYFDGTQIRSLGPQITYADHFFVTSANYSSGTSLPPWIGPDFFFTPFSLDKTLSNASDSTFSATTRGYGVAVTCQTITNSSAKNRLNFTEHGERVEFSIVHTLSNGSETTCIDYKNQGGFGGQTTFTQDTPGNGRNGFELLTSMRPIGYTANRNVSDGGECERLLVAGWVRMGPGITPATNTPTNGTVGNRIVDSIFLSCQPTLQTALFDVTVDVTGQILDSKQRTPFDTDLQPFFKGKTTAQIADPAEFMTDQTMTLYLQANDLIASVTAASRGYQWHNATVAADWATYLLNLKLNSTDLVNVNTHLPSPSIIAPALESLYRQLFAALIGLNTHIFGPPDPAETITVKVTTPEIRIYMSDIMFKITLIILFLNFFVAIAFYTHRPKRFLPMMPTTIASIAGLVVATRAVKDYSWDTESYEGSEMGNGNLTNPESSGRAIGIRSRTNKATVLEKRKKRQDLRYGYGRFIGTDGALRIGIERHPWVVPLDSVNSAHMKKRTPWGFWKKRESEDEGKGESA